MLFAISSRAPSFVYVRLHGCLCVPGFVVWDATLHTRRLAKRCHVAELLRTQLGPVGVPSRYDNACVFVHLWRPLPLPPSLPLRW